MSEYIYGTDGHEGHWLTGEEIVRCRDCRWSRDDESGREEYEGTLWCDYLTEGIGFNVLPTDFCAWGERKVNA